MSNKKVAVLFTQKNSVYDTIPDCICFDKEKNALNYSDNYPVIAHPPCRMWGRLYKFAKPEPDEDKLAFFAINQVRRCGGVLEHPAHSKLWKVCNLPTGNNFDEFGGWTLSVNQHWFGHLAAKNTWLYIVGCLPRDIPDYSPTFNCVTHTVASVKRNNGKKVVSISSRSATPLQLAKWLIELARNTYVYPLPAYMEPVSSL